MKLPKSAPKSSRNPLSSSSGEDEGLRKTQSPAQEEDEEFSEDEELYADAEDGNRTRSRSPSKFTRSSASPRRPSPDVKHADFEELSQHEDRGSSWTDLDLSIVVALASPVGNWLTGGDHLKTILLVALLVYYLHQLIHVPWSLYLASRPRRPHEKLSASLDPSSADSRLAKLASNSLKRSELSYLLLSVASPFLGVWLIRLLLTTTDESGTIKDPLSWFSTTLFLLATGIRPWGHFVSRLRGRAKELHDAVHYPPKSYVLSLEAEGQTNDLVQALRSRVASLEAKLERSEKRASLTERLALDLEELTQELEERVDDLEGRARDHEDEAEDFRDSSSKMEQQQRQSDITVEARLGVIERAMFGRWKNAREAQGDGIIISAARTLVYYLPFKPSFLSQYDTFPISGHDYSAATNGTSNASPNRIYQPQPTHNPSRLETILEDSDSGSVSSPEEPGEITHVSLPLKSSSTSSRSKPKFKGLRVRTKGLQSNKAKNKADKRSPFLVGLVEAIVAWPYWLSVWVLQVVMAPVRSLVKS